MGRWFVLPARRKAEDQCAHCERSPSTLRAVADISAGPAVGTLIRKAGFRESDDS